MITQATKRPLTINMSKTTRYSLLVIVDTPRGKISGRLTEPVSNVAELETMLDQMKQDLNKLSTFSFKVNGTEMVVLTKSMIDQSVFSFSIEEQGK